MGLDSFFALRVTAEDDMDTLAQRLLSAALKLQRPPNHCVVFAASPSAVTAAHNCTMKARPPAAVYITLTILRCFHCRTLVQPQSSDPRDREPFEALGHGGHGEPSA